MLTEISLQLFNNHITSSGKVAENDGLQSHAVENQLKLIKQVNIVAIDDEDGRLAGRLTLQEQSEPPPKPIR